MVTVTNDQIYDRRAIGGRLEVNAERAKEQGKPFLLFNGVVYDARTLEEVFFPPFGFWIPETLPFIGWKAGYEYSGTHEWLLGKDVPCAAL